MDGNASTFVPVRLNCSVRKLEIAGQKIELSVFEDKITNEVMKAINELKRAFPAHKSSRFVSIYGSDVTARDAYMIETFDKIGVKIHEAEIFNAVGNYYFIRDKEKSRTYYERALHLNPDNADAHTSMGFWYLLYGNDLKSAKQECDLVIKKDSSNHPWTYVCLGTVYKRLGIADEQYEAIENAKKMFSIDVVDDKTNFWAHFGLGWCWSEGKDKNFEKAIECQKQALKLRPDFAPARYNLACLLAQRQSATDAVTELRHLISGPKKLLEFFGIAADSDFKCIANNDEFVNFMEAININYTPKSSESAPKNTEDIAT